MPTIHPAKAVFVAGLTCGVMDISAALVVYGLMGSKPLRLLQGIAGGILGPRTYSGGISTALFGLALHFVIAFGAAAIFFLASRVMPFLLTHAVLSGVFYGIAVYFFMNRVVVQLSAATEWINSRAKGSGKPRFPVKYYCRGLSVEDDVIFWEEFARRLALTSLRRCRTACRRPTLGPRKPSGT